MRSRKEIENKLAALKEREKKLRQMRQEWHDWTAFGSTQYQRLSEERIRDFERKTTLRWVLERRKQL